jgi:2-polyprenyl-3-methyl-5-hydroxy-6-metoxy-1,4-benzoquinol methylase
MNVGGNVYDKYGTSNPIERRLVGGFLDEVCGLVDRTRAGEAHEVGCGEGEISLLLARRGLRVRGSDVSADVIAEARRRATAAGVDVPYRAAPISALDPARDAAELIVCCEVLEHLDDPAAGLDALAELARPWLLVSVPREPIWRVLNLARGKYVRDLGNTPGHLGHWSRRRFLELLGSRVEVVAVRSPLPWTLALCRANGR